MAAARLDLPDVIDLVAVEPLRAAILEHRGKDLQIDGGAVHRISGLGIQVLLSAEATWAHDGHVMRTVNRSPNLSEALRLTGAKLQDIA